MRIARLGIVVAALVALAQAPRPDGVFTVAVNTTTIEAGPVYVAAAAPGGASFRVINGSVRNLGPGGADAATNAETQMLLATPSNPAIRMLLTVAEGHYRVIARKSAGITSLGDLRGRRITTVPQTSAHYYLYKMLKSAGVQDADVKIVTVDRTDMAAAVARGEADAISMWEPEAQKALDALGQDATVFKNVGLYRELFSLYTTTDVLGDRKRRSELVAFVRAVLAATDTIHNRPQDAIPVIAKRLDLLEATIRKVWEHHVFPAALPAEMLDVLTEEEDWAAGLQKRAPRTREQLAGFIDASVLKEAREGTR
jgi:sulfonate transport system substrate-binding protein